MRRSGEQLYRDDLRFATACGARRVRTWQRCAHRRAAHIRDSSVRALANAIARALPVRCAPQPERV
eukprot:1652378-Pleurochrysis_carterae.AAC.1